MQLNVLRMVLNVDVKIKYNQGIRRNMKKTLILPIIMFSLLVALCLNHMVRGLNFIPIAFLLFPTFGLIVVASKEED